MKLDCQPGYPRPGDLIEKVIENLGLEKKEARNKLCGNWVWDYSNISEDKWGEIQPTLKERITDLYNKGMIRYGSW